MLDCKVTDKLGLKTGWQFSAYTKNFMFGLTLYSAFQFQVEFSKPNIISGLCWAFVGTWVITLDSSGEHYEMLLF